ncbi:MAG: DUF1471 domain-containing protein [Candidatus Symbiopectobacterium sp. Dall1.0]|nr:DUF1471 domain-containing protein [Candidatus Symbiopectobacterium sp. Dall1.0]
MTPEQAAAVKPFDRISFSGRFDAIFDAVAEASKRAADKGAKYYHITKQWFNKGSNMTISADLYK